jgi:hypothetical protein
MTNAYRLRKRLPEIPAMMKNTQGDLLALL